MNYELAKQLKDSGYEFDLIQMSKRITSYKDDKGTVYAMPNLSELIEACGDGTMLMCVNKITFYTFKFADNKIFGSTPEEAVAKLWLELNKK